MYTFYYSYSPVLTGVGEQSLLIDARLGKVKEETVVWDDNLTQLVSMRVYAVRLSFLWQCLVVRLQVPAVRQRRRYKLLFLCRGGGESRRSLVPCVVLAIGSSHSLPSQW